MASRRKSSSNRVWLRRYWSTLVFSTSSENRDSTRLATWRGRTSSRSRGVASQILTVLSPLAEARRRRSGLNTTLFTPLVWPLSERASWPVRASQTFTVLSSLAEARRRPSGLCATLNTAYVWPLSVRHSWPVRASQTFTVLSLLAKARCRPSGLYATLL